MSSASSRMATPGMCPGPTCLWLSPGFEFVEGLGGLGQGVGDGFVPVHVGAAGVEFSRALLAQGFCDDQADRLSDCRRLVHIGFGGALNDRGSLRTDGCKRARDHVQDGAYPEEATAPLYRADGI